MSSPVHVLPSNSMLVRQEEQKFSRHNRHNAVCMFARSLPTNVHGSLLVIGSDWSMKKVRDESQ